MKTCEIIVAFCNDINSTCIFIVGDFNADISKSSAFGSILHDFCDDFSFSIVDKDYLPAETYTYVSSAWGTTSWLDHVICTADARECITDMTVLYECICSDHHPLLFCIDFDFVPAYGTGSTSENKRAIHWDSLRPCDINNYTDYTELELNKIKVPQGIKCNDPNCRNHSHREAIDELYDSIVIALKKCSDALVSTGKSRAKDVIVPGWNEQVKELHVEARHAYLTWRDVGKPRQGDVFTTMKLSRSKFKYALRKCKRDKKTVIADNIAEKLCQKDSRDFWKNIKQMTNKKVKLPTNIDGVHGDNDIVSMWKEHYATIFNSVENSSCDQAHSDLFNTNIAFDNGMTVDLFEMKAVIDDLACNKSPGLDGLSSEHFKFAHSRLPALLSTLVTSIVVHGHVPESMNESVIVPIIKDKNKRVNDKRNYRPICLSNICSKIIEVVLFNRMSIFLQSSPNQFGFKPKHGTELCVFAFKELLRFYKKHGSAMHVAFLDASKAFDRVNRRKLLYKLESRGVPTYILRLLSSELIGQCTCVRWGSTHSDFFHIGNGVKQGGILSPLLFNIYMDDLSLQLHRQSIGCSVGGTVVNHMLYADDIVLFAPSAKGLQKLLDISHTYGCNYDIEYNPSKSSIMYIDSRKAGNARSMTIGGKILNVVTAFSYLGHIICDDLSDEADLKAKSRQMYAKSNTLRNKFHMCSTAVKVKLFTAYFNNVYMCALWVNYRKTAFQQFKVAYNNSYRILNRLPMRCSASNMFANGNVNSCACVLRKSIYSLMTRIHASLNPIVNSIVRGDVYCTSALRIQWVSQLYNM